MSPSTTVNQRAELERFRPQILRALAFGGQTHTFENVCEAVEAGTMQSWVADESVTITEIVANPIGTKDLHVFLCAGCEKELSALEHIIMEWAVEEGCTRATCIGRMGWARSWLVKKNGWRPTLICLEKGLTDG